jgi:hypothetical protein
MLFTKDEEQKMAKLTDTQLIVLSRLRRETMVSRPFPMD